MIYKVLNCILFIEVGLLHGDMTQIDRNEVIHAFRKKETPILVATDVAGEAIHFFYCLCEYFSHAI